MTFVQIETRRGMIHLDGYSRNKTLKGALMDLAREVAKIDEGEALAITGNIDEVAQMVADGMDNYPDCYIIEAEEVGCATRIKNPDSDEPEMEYAEGHWYLYIRFCAPEQESAGPEVTSIEPEQVENTIQETETSKENEKMTFTVYAELAPEVSKKLDRLAGKAAAYGVPFNYTMSEEHPQTVAFREADPLTQTVRTVSTYTVPAVDIEVECDGLICANSWTVRARVEHGDNGNIVTGFGGYKVKPEWYTAAPNCDHCHMNRYRGVTFFVEHEDGSIRQVGRTCLKEYTGINPATAAMWAEVHDLLNQLNQDLNCSRDEWERGGYVQMYEVLGVLAHACDVVKEFGYRKSAEPGSTRERVTALLLSGKQPSAEGMKKAVLVRDWLVRLEQVARDQDVAISAAWKKANETGEDRDIRTAWAAEKKGVSDIERNCIPLALSGWAKECHVGLLAYMPLAYERWMERKAREDQRREAGAQSQYVGDVKQRITIEVETVTLLSSWVGDYGTTWLYKFVDSNGNVYIWYASRKCDMAGGTKIKATVKDYNERDGVKQTVVTRCKVLA